MEAKYKTIFNKMHRIEVSNVGNLKKTIEDS